MNLSISYLFPLIALPMIGIALGYMLHFFIREKREQKSLLKIKKLKQKETQLRSDYNILLQAMEGAKAQAEAMQRKLYGTNVMEVNKVQDPETILNRQKLAQFVEKKLMGCSSKTDDCAKATPSNHPKAIESLKALDPEIVNILSEVIKSE